MNLKWIIGSLFTVVMTGIGASGSLLQQAPVAESERRNPYAGNRDARLAGAKLYRRECASCHGDSGQGGRRAPPLSSPLVRKASAGALSWTLKNGAVFHGMPSFSHLSEQQRWQIITYLQSEIASRE